MLFELYQQLLARSPNPCPHFFGAKIVGPYGLWLALDADGYPHLLFEMDKANDQPDLKLKSVGVRFGCACDIQMRDGGFSSGIYALVSLQNDDLDIVRVFLRLLEEAFLVPNAVHSPDSVREQILSIADLFSQLGEEFKDVLGLWGELHIIRSSKDISSAVKAWSTAHHARYDFMTDNFALEIKTTLNPKRRHRFSREQLRPESPIRVYIASVLLTETPGGETVSELMDQVYSALDNEERIRFFRQCLRKGGADIYGSEARFGTMPGGVSVMVFDAGILPVPNAAEDDPISNIRFDLDLNNVDMLIGRERDQVLSF